MYCEADRLAYEEVVRQSRALERDPVHSDKQHNKRVSKFIGKEWGPFTPPGRATLLPVGKYRVAFLRIDTRAVEQMYGMKREQRDDFFLQRYFHLTSKTANIPCMKSRQNRKYTRDVLSFVDGIRRRVRTPWLLGASVMSDGVQLKATLNSLHDDHPLAPGTKVLKKAGYQLATKPAVSLESLLEKGRGAYNMRAVFSHDPDVIDRTKFNAVDPGQKRPVEIVSASGADWRRDNAPTLLQSSWGVAAEDYRRDTLATFSEEAEEKRRGSADDR